MPAVSATLINQMKEDIQLSRRTQLSRDCSQLTVELPAALVIEGEERNEFAESPRRNAHAVQRADAALLDVVQLACKCREPLLKCVGGCSDHAQGKGSIVTAL